MATRAEIDQDLCARIVSFLAREIEQKGEASLAVSGGSTPKELFKFLSKTELDWEKVTVIPVDERLVTDGHPDQNGSLIKNFLLQEKAAKAKFYPLVYDAKEAENNLKQALENLNQVPTPITVVVLGMGTDGHTASLFPGSSALEKGIDPNFEQELLNVTPPAAPYERISMSRNFIAKAKHIFLHFYGEEKQEVLEEVRKKADHAQYPIYAFLTMPQLQIFNAD